MKIVEIIVLMGTQCVSPIQHAPMMTEVSKVPCAVVIEKDTVTSVMEVSPPAAVNHPTVSEAMVRLSAQTQTATAATVPAASQPFRIEPAAAARRAAIAAPIMPPVLPGAGKPLQEPLAPPAAAVAPEAETIPPPEMQVASRVEEPQDVSVAPEPPAATAAEPAKPAAKAKTVKRKKSAPTRTAGLSDRCKGAATAKWYKNKQGHMKYRCVSGSRSATPKKAAGAPAKALY